MNLTTLEVPKEKNDLKKPTTPSIVIQNSQNTAETFYGKFRSIVKQRFFGIKLEETSFMEFIDSNEDMKKELTNLITFMDKLKEEFLGYLKKNFPEKFDKKKKKKKSKKAEFLLDVPKGDDAFSSDYSGLSLSRDASISREETEATNEMQVLKTKLDSIKKDFCFDSVENVAKNIHLFDDVFGKLKAEHTKNQQLSQLRQLGLMNFGISSSDGNLAFAFPGSQQTNEQNVPEDQIPHYFTYFDELYHRWDKACEETGLTEPDYNHQND